ncbi:putative proliferating cell nuclear antigen [Encephalitozoon hellem ATCC 50504]|uniref:DNA sliding clamp PCNA n=1 Tax=Encephalitozoon hellem TaxID=27973 RepID=A0A9Q9C316_ENCHE|nr:putative proliferating cell nuclear antigen [Encephalitozoon hellem ATCC 50504]AFM98322.1 putative proliferating cell nuclear antigen [Encephalitozoon hellem ATCC 50504]UTX43201.1 proliferating cell nuclear antigen [Encephalitozoon hellem]WEL38658.1 proliferating cell nuclear antigen [Encephalitozoon hellem]|eukprot:XP_003887303.1 putative proliferating cell nuclear antigen [Encephalitozoon hellem ATCC 50504]
MFELELTAREKGKDGVQTDSLSLMKRILESLNEIVETADIKATERGLLIQVMDVTHVAFADIFLSSAMFTKYRCDRELVIGVQLKTFTKIIKGMSVEGGGIFRLECDDATTTLNVKNIREGNVLSFKLKLFSSDTEAYNVPEFEFDASATIPADEFMYVPRLVGTFGDVVGVQAENKTLMFFQTGEHADASMSFEESPAREGIKIDAKELITQEIAMKYVNLISKVVPLCKDVKISLGSGKPVFFGLCMDDFAHMKLYVAPKFENDY